MIRAYDEDYAGWADDTAKAIEEGRFEEVDRVALADEVASLGRTERRQITSAFLVLLTHLLKIAYQPDKLTRSWENTVRREQRNIVRYLKDSPSLKSNLDDFLADAYEDALYQAEAETGLALSAFPEKCEWTLAEVMGT